MPDASSPFLVKALIKFFFENSLTGVNSTLELAKPATDIGSAKSTSPKRRRGAETAGQGPLENPFLGKSCYVGSSTLADHLETDQRRTTAPPGPNSSITGSAG